MLPILKILPFLFLSCAFATIIPDQSDLWFTGSPSAQLKDITHTFQLKNPNSKPAFIHIQLLQVIYPATNRETRTFIQNTKGTQSMFVINPESLIIPPKSFRGVSLIFTNLHAVSEELVFYLIIKQVFPEKLIKTQKSTQPTINLHFITNPIIHVLPPHPKIAYVIKKKSQQILITNTGNVHFTLRFCEEQRCNKKTDYTHQNVYPHQTLTFTFVNNIKHKKITKNSNTYNLYGTTLTLDVLKPQHFKRYSFSTKQYKVLKTATNKIIARVK